MSLDFRFSPEAEALRVAVRECFAALTEDECAAHADPADLTGLAEEFERSWHRALGDRGWLDLPVELQAVVNFEAAHHDAPVVDTAMTLCGTAIARFGSDAHRTTLLPRLASGELQGCVAYTEAAGGTDLTTVRTTATRCADGWVLDGVKTLVTGAHKADVCVTLARTDPEAPARRGLSMFVLEMNRPGVTVVRKPTMNGWTLGEVHFDGVRLTEADLLGVENGGWRHLAEALAAERSGMFWLGFARRVLDLLASWTRTADRSGALPADDPLVLDAVGALEIAYRDADRTSRRALWSQLHETDATTAAAMAKVVTTELLQRIAQVATELAGQDGVVWSPLFQGGQIPGAAAGGRFAWEYLERVHGTISVGANELQRDVIARTGLGLGGRR